MRTTAPSLYPGATNLRRVQDRASQTTRISARLSTQWVNGHREALKHAVQCIVLFFMTLARASYPLSSKPATVEAEWSIILAGKLRRDLSTWQTTHRNLYGDSSIQVEHCGHDRNSLSVHVPFDSIRSLREHITDQLLVLFSISNILQSK